MIYDLAVYETISGEIVEMLQHRDLTWNTPLDDSGQASATIDLAANTFDVAAVTTPWRFSLLASTADTVHWFGPITPGRTYNNDGTITLPASELWAILKARPLIGNYADVGPGVPPADATFNSSSLPGIAVQIVKQATSMAGGALPLILPEFPEGTDNTRTYVGTDWKDAASALTDLSGVIDGPDIRFDGQFVGGSRARATWLMRVG